VKQADISRLMKTVSEHKTSGIYVVGEYWVSKIVKKKRGNGRGKGC
jgi:hypothetical protein